MFFIYDVLNYIVGFILRIIALFNKKISLFISGRKNSWRILEEKIKQTDRVFWIHAASLGEYEQGLPLIEQLKIQNPEHKIVLTFFSPSGYEVKKNNIVADATLYLPMDTKKNAKRFLKIVHPEKAFFIKYEYWPNYLNQLKEQKIDTYLVSGILRPNQVFFKWYGGFYRKALQAFTFFFVQNTISAILLKKLGYSNVAVVGDTRFDRVSQILERDNTLDFIDEFKNNQTTIVIGSSWPQDEALLERFINSQKDSKTKFIFAPHNIKPDLIADLTQKLNKPTVLYSERIGKKLSEYQILIIDAYSLLTKTYSYADIAYIGGGFGSGIHNILEAATFGVPVIIGPNYKKFQEAKDLVALGSCFVVKNQEELNATFYNLLTDSKKRAEIGQIAQRFILNNKNATLKIMNQL